MSRAGRISLRWAETTAVAFRQAAGRVVVGALLRVLRLSHDYNFVTMNNLQQMLFNRVKRHGLWHINNL